MPLALPLSLCVSCSTYTEVLQLRDCCAHFRTDGLHSQQGCRVPRYLRIHTNMSQNVMSVRDTNNPLRLTTTRCHIIPRVRVLLEQDHEGPELGRKFAKLTIDDDVNV